MTAHRNVTAAEVYAETARRDLAQNAHQQPAHGAHAHGVAGPAANVLRDVLGAAERPQSMATATASEGCRPVQIGPFGGPRSVRERFPENSLGSRRTRGGGRS